jgi:hypothetical protein
VATMASSFDRGTQPSKGLAISTTGHDGDLPSKIASCKCFLPAVVLGPNPDSNSFCSVTIFAPLPPAGCCDYALIYGVQRLVTGLCRPKTFESRCRSIFLLWMGSTP